MPDPNLYSAPQEAIFSWSHFVAALKSPLSFSSLAIFPRSSAAWWSSLSFKSLLLTLRAASLKSAAGFPGRISAVDLRFFGLLVMVARLFFTADWRTALFIVPAAKKNRLIASASFFCSPLQASFGIRQHLSCGALASGFLVLVPTHCLMRGFVDPSKKDDDGYVSVPSLWAIDDFQELRDMSFYMAALSPHHAAHAFAICNPSLPCRAQLRFSRWNRTTVQIVWTPVYTG